MLWSIDGQFEIRAKMPCEHVIIHFNNNIAAAAIVKIDTFSVINDVSFSAVTVIGLTRGPKVIN
jgi:hypothetical protein